MQQQQRANTRTVPQTAGEGGYVTLFAALLVTVVGISLATSLLLSGGSGALRESALEFSAEARAYADACAESGLYDIRNGIQYSGEGEISLSNGSCSYTVDAESETMSRVESTGFAESAIRKVRVIVTTEIVVVDNSTSTAITDIDWQEVAEF